MNQQPVLQLDPHLRRVALIIGYMVIAAGFVYAVSVAMPFLRFLMGILAPFLVALVVAYLFNPVVTFFQRRLRLSRVVGVLFVNLILVLVAAGFLAIIAPILVVQIRSAYSGISDTIQRRAAPALYRTMGFTIEPAEASEQQLLRRIGDWYGTQLQDAPPSARTHFERLNVSTIKWMTENPAPGGPDAGKSDLAGLKAMVEEWASKHPLYTEGDPARDAAIESLEASVGEWIAARAAFERGEIREPSLEEIRAHVRAELARRGVDIDAFLRDMLQSNQVRTAATEGVGFVGTALLAIGRAASSLVTSVMFLVFVFLVSFYLLVDFANLRGIAEILCPDKHEKRLFDVLAKVDVAVGGFIRGQLTVATIVGVLATIGLMALGLKQYALLIGVITGIGNLIPYLGPVMGATPAVLYVLFSESYDTGQERLVYLGLIVALFAFLQFIEGFFLQPRIVGRNAQLHPVAVIFALACGAPFGVIGMIIALPVAAIIRVLLKEFFWDAREAEWHRTTGKVRLDDVGGPGTPA